MAVIFGRFSHSTFATSLPHLSSFSPPPTIPVRIACSSSSSPASTQMDPQNNGGKKRYIDFPYLTSPYKDLMVDIVSTVETRLEPYLLPTPTLPPDAQYYQNEPATAQIALHARSGLKPSPIDFILGSWVHCELPFGALNIVSLSAYLGHSTDAPNFIIELIQAKPTSLVLVLDLPPRKDPVLHPDYLVTFYEDTQLDRHRKRLEQIPEVSPYISPSLFIRSSLSPTAIVVTIETESGGTERIDEIVRDHVSPVAKEVLGVWLDQCACGERVVAETEQDTLVKRDEMFRNKSIEIDLGSSLPRLFGEEVALRILGTIKEIFST